MADAEDKTKHLLLKVFGRDACRGQRKDFVTHLTVPFIATLARIRLVEPLSSIDALTSKQVG